MNKNRVEISQGELAYTQMINEIRLGDLRPGDHLREMDLAKRLGMSRTPIREALKALENDGLVVHNPRQGAVIRQLEYAEVMELYEMRAVLEGTAARLAAHTALSIEIDEMVRLNDKMRKVKSADEAFLLNQLFHKALLNAAKNRFLTRSVENMHKALLCLGPTTLAKTERLDSAVQEHDAILDALHARDGVQAETFMRKHIRASQQARIRALNAFEGSHEA